MNRFLKIYFLTIALAGAALSGCKTSSSCCCEDGANWTVLFDGKSTDALRGYKVDHFPSEAWKLDGGTLKTLTKEEGGKHVDLMTKEKYTNFELVCEWKVSPGGNSGIIYKVTETGPASHSTGFECQVLDDSQHGDGKKPLTSAGALYALIAPNANKKLKPVGEWNEARIIVKGTHGEHWLNGKKIVEYEQGSPELKGLIAQSKFAKLPTFGTITEGHVCFQNHGQEVWFRNIKIRKL